MTRSSFSAALAFSLIVAVGVACAQREVVRTQTYASSKTKDLDVRKVAIAPFRTSQSFKPTGERDPDARTATALVERFVAEALVVRGIEVIPAGDMRTVLKLEEGMAPPPLRIVAQVANQEFGVPALVTGTVYRIRERTGDIMASSRPASVYFDVLLVSAPGGARMWSATFNETQQPLNENVLRAARYPGGGTRWLRAEELARWGAQQLALAFPTGAGAPRY